MSDQQNHPGPENQQQRWIKYGSNVVLVSVVVVLLALVVGYLAQQSWAKGRVDTTQLGLYSLKPQTKAVLHDLKQNVRIVSLYKVVKPPAGKEKDYVDLATPVADLLNEYKRYGGGKIDVDVIDPTQNPAKVEDLINDVTTRYGGEVQAYSGFLTEYKDKISKDVRTRLTAEAKAAPTKDQLKGDKSELADLISRATGAINEDTIPRLDDVEKARDKYLEQKPPNYKAAVDDARSALSGVADDLAGVLVSEFTRLKDDKRASQPARDYAAAAISRLTELKKVADTAIEKSKKLGELKLDELRKTLKAENGIVVMGPKDLRVLDQNLIWQIDPNVRQALRSADKKIKPQFAGEQQITSAILALTQDKKPKVAFVRAGGPPLTSPGMLFGPPPGDLSRVASRLKDYNFEVLEKDLSGMWAMQQQMQQRGMPPEPEPDDAAIKDAVWIVVATRGQPGPMGPPPSIAPKVAEHLKAGGSALILASVQGEDVSTALTDYGIKVRPDVVIVHEPVPGGTGAQGDFINQARKIPFVFVLNNYGNHMLTAPLQSLDMPLVAGIPVMTEAKPGIKSWNLLPIPNDTPTWGETNVDALGGGEPPKFDEASDLKGPLYAGAAAQKETGEGRVVVIGNTQFLMNDMVRFRDQELEQQGYIVARFPGSAELFTNSVFWLSKMEPMIAISPAAMDVSRIEPMTKGGEWFLRTGVLLIGLPLLVVLAGGFMYLRRRD